MKSTPCSTSTPSNSTGLNGPPPSGTPQPCEVHGARNPLSGGSSQLLRYDALEVRIDLGQPPFDGEPTCERGGRDRFQRRGGGERFPAREDTLFCAEPALELTLISSHATHG